MLTAGYATLRGIVGLSPIVVFVGEAEGEIFVGMVSEDKVFVGAIRWCHFGKPSDGRLSDGRRSYGRRSYGRTVCTRV